MAAFSFIFLSLKKRKMFLKNLIVIEYLGNLDVEGRGQILEYVVSLKT